MRQGALYYPYIQVPESAWFTRALLYWDEVASIVPYEMMGDPERMSPYMRDLMSNGLLRAMHPDSVLDGSFGDRFIEYIMSMSPPQLRRRQDLFAQGETTPIHRAKFTWRLFSDLGRLGLASSRIHQRGDWFHVETCSANELMAGIALSMCDPSSFPLTVDGQEVQWLPTTDREDAAEALLAGHISNQSSSGGRLRRLLRGQSATEDLRLELLSQLLPVPDGAVEVGDLLQFRIRHGDLLPTCRRYIEEHIDAAATIDDEDMRARYMDRLLQEADQMLEQAAAYQRETFRRTIVQSPIFRLLKAIPGASGLTSGIIESAERSLSHPHLATEPLAYLAFAQAKFAPRTVYRVDPTTGIPLTEAIASRGPRV
jgi:hypothetical protein